jgi:hypothetical protein
MGKIVSNSAKYAAVDYFEILQEPAPSGIVRGIASPAGGPAPCALVLFSGQTMIATAPARDFSAAAKAHHIRLGWCGFEIGGLSQALAHGQEVELRCLTSGKVLAQWESTSLAVGLIPQHRKFLTVGDMLKKLGNEGACPDISHILPFALALSQTRGTRPFLEASFRYLLGRQLDSAAELRFAGDYTTDKAVLSFWHTVLDSPERDRQAKLALPGPFDPFFPFPLDALDA